MSRQYFMDLLSDPPIANQSAVTATTETALWNAAQFTPIMGSDPRPGKVYRVTAGGVLTTASTGTIIITPRYGLSVGAGTSLGANAAITVPGVTSNVPWLLDFVLVCRVAGAPGANSTVIGTGCLNSNGTGTAGTGLNIAFGGTQATVDFSVASGLTFGWTLSVAGSITPQFAFIQSLN